MENKSLLRFRKKCMMVFIGFACFTFLMNLALPGWFIFYRPAFRGRVLDAETGKPVEGAAVVAMYSKFTLARHLITRVIVAVLGGDSGMIGVRETLTDRNGDFRIPSYLTIINPLSQGWPTRFVIFRPGYRSFPKYQESPCFPVTAQKVFF